MAGGETAVKWFTAVGRKTLSAARRPPDGVYQQYAPCRASLPPPPRRRPGPPGEAQSAIAARSACAAAALRVLPARDGGWHRPQTKP